MWKDLALNPEGNYSDLDFSSSNPRSKLWLSVSYDQQR